MFATGGARVLPAYVNWITAVTSAVVGGRRFSAYARGRADAVLRLGPLGLADGLAAIRGDRRLELELPASGDADHFFGGRKRLLVELLGVAQLLSQMAEHLDERVLAIVRRGRHGHRGGLPFAGGWLENGAVMREDRLLEAS